MTMLDMRTVIFFSVVNYMICTLFIAQLWQQNHHRFAGTARWVFGFILQTVALVLIILRATIPDWLSMVMANALLVAGAILIFQGLERFMGKKGPQGHNYLLLTLFIYVHGYFALVQPSLAMRTLNLSVASFLINFQCVWLLWRRVEPPLRPFSFGVGAVFFLYCLVAAIRIAQFFLVPHVESSYLNAGPFEVLMVVSHQVLFILLTYVLILQVNKRLLAKIGAQEEKFAKAFHSAPYAITMTRPSDGQIFDVNETFVFLTGYSRTEVIGRKTTDLHLWERDQDRDAVVDALSRKGAVSGMEMLFRKKNGQRIVGLFSAELITIDGEKYILSSIGDITDRKQAEEALRESENRYRELSIVDDLTQLYNARHFYHQIKLEIDRADRYEQPLTLLLLDLDDFKRFNDAYGHVEGDQVLVRLGLVLKRSLRQTDSAYRYGGEEFTILLPMTTGAEGAVTAERIRTAFKQEIFSPEPGRDEQLTVSVGLAQHKPKEEMKAFVHRVDQLMYQGKRNGKDRVCGESQADQPCAVQP